jgi:hypothetical protein
VVVLAVRSEPVSGDEIPAKWEFYRENGQKNKKYALHFRDSPQNPAIFGDRAVCRTGNFSSLFWAEKWELRSV